MFNRIMEALAPKNTAEAWAVTSFLGAAKGPFFDKSEADDYAQQHGGRVIRMVEAP